ncbi:MAG: HAD-IC family P-type ATPase, partial [Planctomycetaceae bacterium]|nr:HAD-IC family P-type ATPase [Planctomycetaceae bacterium]
RHAIMRRLPAVETLGSVDVICSDKTGTLTQNRMTIADVLSAGERSGADRDLLLGGILCNDADLSHDGQAVGTPTEAAFVLAAAQAEVDIHEIRQRWPRVGEVPFSSDRKRMSTLHRDASGRQVVVVKGAAEAVLARCSTLGLPAELTDGEHHPQPMTGEALAEWNSRVEELAARGRRVLAVAAQSWSSDELPDAGGEAEQELSLLGIVGLVDPARPEAADAISECRAAGIRPIMITGDHQVTAKAIAEDLGLYQPGDRVVTGTELAAMNDEQFSTAVGEISVYARVSPEHKLRIVRAHQQRGSVVAMTGDGVNDAPALKQSDIGIAMGQTGTDVSKQAADMILADDNFATIVAAVEEGRVVYDNIRKFVRHLLSTNIGEILVLFLAILLGLPLPLVPVQILWINL